MRPPISRPTSVACATMALAVAWERTPASPAMVARAWTSALEPSAMRRNLTNSRSEPRSAPSAMFDTTEIPALAFAYFDPGKGTYQTIHSEPIALSVKGGAVVGAAQVVGAPTGGSAAPAAEPSTTLSLAGVDLALSPPGVGGGGLGSGVLWAIVATLYLAPLALLGLAVTRRRGAARREVVGEVKAALRACAAELERARQAPRPRTTPADAGRRQRQVWSHLASR